MISYLGSLVQFSPAVGRAGHCRQMSVYGEHSPCSGQAARSFGGFSPGAACLFPPRRAARAARGLHALSPGAACLFPPRRAAPGSQGLVCTLPRVRRTFSLCCERPRWPEAWRPLPWCGAPFPSAASGSGSQMLGALSPGAALLFPPWPQCAPPVGSQEVFI